MTEDRKDQKPPKKKAEKLDVLCEWTITATDKESGEVVHKETRKESDNECGESSASK